MCPDRTWYSSVMGMEIFNTTFHEICNKAICDSKNS